MIVQNIVGQPSAGSPNAVMNGRAGQQGDAIVSELHGRFYEANYRGNLFFGGHTAPTALSGNTVLLTASTTPILGVWNPSTNTNNLVMLQATLTTIANNTTSSAAPGAFVWAISLGNGAISTGANPWNARTLLQSGSNAKTFAGSTALTGLTNNLTIVAGANLPSPGALTYTTLASTALYAAYAGREDFDGSLIVPPGGVLALLNTASTATAFSCYGRLHWEEVPV